MADMRGGGGQIGGQKGLGGGEIEKGGPDAAAVCDFGHRLPFFPPEKSALRACIICTFARVLGSNIRQQSPDQHRHVLQNDSSLRHPGKSRT
jgi:hypothetical protein